MGPLSWAFLLLFAAACVIVAELFVPSGGILAALSTCLVIASIVMAFLYEPWIGLLWVIGTSIGVPVLLSVAVRWWPRTAIGRRMLPQVPTADEVLPDAPRLDDRIGGVGIAKSPMLPGGVITIEGELFDALSEGMPIDAGQPVRVVAVRGQRLIVRPHEGPLPERPSTSAEDNVLDQPLENLGIEPLEDPLG